MNTFQPGAAVAPCSKVELSISCKNLRDTDVTSKSDPMCVVLMCRGGSQQYSEIGRTEVIKNTQDPDFIKKFTEDYYFEESQKMRFEVYDADSKSQRLEDHDFLGSMDCTLGEIVSVQGSRFIRPLTNPSGNKKLGSITVIAEEVSSCREVVTMQWSAKKLDKKDFRGKSDPFLVFLKSNEDGSFTTVHKTEVVKNNLSPTWRPCVIKSTTLCSGDPDRPLKVQCYDWDSDGSSHDLIGEFSCTLRTLQKGPCAENVYQCINPKKTSKQSYKNSGTVTLMNCAVHEQATFLDYIQKGTQLHFTVAVDFTASNGDPRTPQSLHYMGQQANVYTLVIQAVGDIIQDYDADKMFPALGFGARLPPTGEVSHEFFLNGNPSSPYCPGVQGILEAYQRTLHTVQLYGPTNFSPVINHVSRFATSYQDGRHYFVLLIITDGEITDMAHTKDAIVRASALPMSIIIVGVGNADFGAMNELDGDNVRITSQGRVAERDIVQFVAFRDFLGNQNPVESKARLAKEVLAEVPNQLVAYMEKRGFRPGNPV
ncbi:copine-8 isoform X1 [Ixodes scapularis]|uniref:copine-8 isoform X1 n=1 Tax=Ixodes scapularis TaxID=6945 RepID=UPI001A9F0B9E|nr:copine-8 isoform X1 [Ixodes scapularis]XP_029842848.2 copine-8 isoform X1 [Ixodes scapularis]